MLSVLVVRGNCCVGAGWVVGYALPFGRAHIALRGCNLAPPSRCAVDPSHVTLRCTCKAMRCRHEHRAWGRARAFQLQQRAIAPERWGCRPALHRLVFAGVTVVAACLPAPLWQTLGRDMSDIEGLMLDVIASSASDGARRVPVDGSFYDSGAVVRTGGCAGAVCCRHSCSVRVCCTVRSVCVHLPRTLYPRAPSRSLRVGGVLRGAVHSLRWPCL
jgi:hypothetical protein